MTDETQKTPPETPKGRSQTPRSDDTVRPPRKKAEDKPVKISDWASI